ncbi:MAG: ABC transporter permease [Solobacterium sp.]|nr:ABC transporter permease [Solobacterium sp.]
MKKLKSSRIFDKAIAMPESAVITVLCILIIIIGVTEPNFFKTNNIMDVLRNASYSFIIAAPLTLNMMSGGMDLTIGAVTSLGGVVCAALILAGVPVPLAILGAILAGVICGLIKAYVTVTIGLQAFIATLGLRYVFDGAILVYTRGDPMLISNVSDAFKALGQGKLGPAYWSVIIALLFGIVFQIILSKTRYGRNLCAVGGNEETARLAGVNVSRTRYIISILLSATAAFVGVIYCSRFNSAQPTIGSGTEMTIMAAAIIGGASVGGGSGSLIGTFLGTLLIAIIKNGLVLMKVSSYWQNLVFGAILVLSLYIDKIRRSKTGGQ